MPRYVSLDHTAAAQDGGSTAMLLLNLGTPAAPTSAAVRSYLAQFLSDPRVIEAPRWAWWPILHGYILRTRPAQSAAAYAKIWRDDGSPLLTWSEKLATALGDELARRYSTRIRVALAMTYGEPSVTAALHALLQNGARKILILPLFPQYSATSGGAALDAVYRALLELRWMPDIRTITAYHIDAGYLRALADSIQTHWSTHGRARKLLLSFHGIPQSYADAGDPYPKHCQETAEALRRLLQISEDELLVTFQSRLGRQPWLRPYTDKTVQQLGKQGVDTLDVACPGFAVDCLETLEEVALRYRSTFLTSGGKQFHYIPALNASTPHITALADIASRALGGWATPKKFTAP